MPLPEGKALRGGYSTLASTADGPQCCKLRAL